MTRHDTVGNHNVLAESRRCGFQRDTIVVRVSRHATYNDVVTTVQIECVVVIVVAIYDTNAVNPDAVTSQIVLHPASAIT